MATQSRYPVVLSIAGFDPSGGAGMQADIKTISALGCFATSVLTALPIQNTQIVESIFEIPSSVVQRQLEVLLNDITPDAIKIGMVNTSENATAVSNILKMIPNIPVIFDPVMLSSSGSKLMKDSAISEIIVVLIPKVSLLTPNLDEASLLAQMPIKSQSDMLIAARKIIKLGCNSVLIKGGHLKSDKIPSLYLNQDLEVAYFAQDRILSKNTRGTGCTLSAAIASYIAQKLDILSAIDLAHQYVYNAIEHSKDSTIGRGNGPVNHFFDPQILG